MCWQNRVLSWHKPLALQHALTILDQLSSCFRPQCCLFSKRGPKQSWPSLFQISNSPNIHMSETFHRWFTSSRLFTFRKILCLISNNKKGLCFTGGRVTHGSLLLCMVQSAYIFFNHVNESLYEIFVLPLCTWLVGVPRDKCLCWQWNQVISQTLWESSAQTSPPLVNPMILAIPQ